MKSVSCAGGKEDKRMICKNCGAEIRDGALFCRHCGTKVNAGQEGRSGKKRNARTTGNAGQGAGLGQGSLGKGNLTVVLMTLAAAVAVAVISVVCVWMFRKESPEESKEWLEVTGNPAQEEKHPVTLCLYPAMDIRTEEGGQAVPVAGVTAYIWKGTYGTEVSADVKETLTAGEDGMLHADLPLGTYTAQFVSGGYLDTYLEFCVDGDGVSQAAYAVRRPEKGQTIAVLSWEGDGVDLDLTLFAGGQADDMEAPRIGGNLMENGLGDRLVADNDRDCEVMIMHSDGDYSLYVNNYTDSQAGNYESETLSNANARLFLYDEDGFVSAYTIPAGQRGVIWEAAQISGGTVTGGGRVYAELTGGKWWLEDKEAGLLVKEVWYSGDGRVDSWIEYDYDSQEKHTRSIKYNKDGSKSLWFDYSYDTEGNLVEEILYADRMEYEWIMDDKGILFSGVYQYDNRGFLTEENSISDAGAYELIHAFDHNNPRNKVWKDDKEVRIDQVVCEYYGGEWLDGDGSIGGHYKYSYDSQGNLKETDDMWVAGREEYDYDSQGKRTEMRCFNSFGEQYLRCEYSYDIQGDLVKKTYYNSEGVYYWIEYEYDSQRRKIKESLYCSNRGDLLIWFEYSYDSQGNMIGEKWYSEGEMNKRYEYGYDSRGNLISEIVHYGNEIREWKEYFYE